MKSLYRPEKSFGHRFFLYAYALVSKKLGINPISEGRRYRQRVEKLFFSDVGALRDEGERKRRLEEANLLAERYVRRTQKFFTVFQRYCYVRGQVRGLMEMEEFIADASEQRKKFRDRMKALEEAS